MKRGHARLRDAVLEHYVKTGRPVPVSELVARLYVRETAIRCMAAEAQCVQVAAHGEVASVPALDAMRDLLLEAL